MHVFKIYCFFEQCFLIQGMLDAGLGPTGINSILSALNIPTVNATTLKHYERKVGEAGIALANESCEAAIQEERKLTIQQRQKE